MPFNIYAGYGSERFRFLFDASLQPPMSVYAGGLSAPSESSLFFVRVFQTGQSYAVERWLRPAL